VGKEYHGELVLASKGFFYDEKLKDGTVHVTPWGTQDERLLISPSINFTDTVTRLIKRCTDLEMDPVDLLLVDRWHLFLYMRCLSYGGDYSFNYRCEECGEKMRHTMDLEKDLEVTYADDEHLLEALETPLLEEPFSLHFPVNDKTIRWRMLRGRDEIAVDKYVKRMRQSSRKSLPKGEDPGYAYRLARRIVEIDGEEPSISDALGLIESLRGKDALAIRQAIRSVDFGVEQDLHPICDNCGWENEVSLPLDKTFFLPERRVA